MHGARGACGALAANRVAGRLACGLGLLVTVTACQRIGSGSAKAGSGRLDARWTRADTGTLAAPATAEWCTFGRYVKLQAANGDTGLAIAIFPADTKQTSLSGRYRIQDTLTDASRPAAAVALRWSNPTSVSGFRSDSGFVILRRGPDGLLAGEVKATGRILGGMPKRLAVTGTFQDVAVTPAPPGCQSLQTRLRPMNVYPDTGVDFPDDSILLRRFRGRPGADLLPQRFRPQGGGGRPPQRGLPQRSGGGAPRQ